MAEALKSVPVQTFTIPEGIQFAEIDQTTGALVSEPSTNTTTEVFAEGTVPQRPVRSTANPLDFYEFDQLEE